MVACLSPELRVMLAPARTYRRMMQAAGERVERRAWLLRPLLVALVLGTSVALSATGRASVGLVLSSSVCWSFVPGVQILALRAAIGRGAQPLSFRNALDLFFLGHAPWSLWMLAVALATALSFPEGSAGWTGIGARVHWTAVFPASWTARIVFCFFREVLALPPRRAALRAAFYELMVWGVALGYASYATQLWTRVGAFP